MNINEVKTQINSSDNTVMFQEISLYQRNLSTEIATWLRQVESKAKNIKKGKVIVVAIIKD